MSRMVGGHSGGSINIAQEAAARGEAYLRGAIMAHCIPARRVPTVNRHIVIYARPMGLNPYPLFERDFYDWNDGYEFETQRREGA